MFRLNSALFRVLFVPLLAIMPLTVAAAQQPDPLAGTTWQLASIGGRNVAVPSAEEVPSVTFGSDGSITGYGGCNTFGGSYSASGDRLTVGNLVSTRRACLDEARMEQETALLSALTSASTFRVEGGQLVLEYGRGESLVLSRTQSLVGSAWVLVSYGDPDDPTPAVRDSVTTLSFSDEGTAGGSGGCNNYGGSYTLGSANSIRFSEIASTMMACLGEGVMEQEGAYLEALNTATGYSLTNEQLIITYGEGEQLTFRRVFQLAGTAWELVAYGAADAPTTVTSGSAITLEFDEDNVASGSGGCNSYRSQGSVVEPDGSLSFGEVASTRMACEGLMEQERAYFAALQSATDFSIVDGQLVLTYGEGEQLVFTPLATRE